MIAIGIPTVNLWQYLEQTIDSIKTKHEYKLLLVDNHSIDGTREKIEQYPCDHILNDTNVGVSKSWNQIISWGLAHDDCDIVFMLNNDIVLKEITIDNMVATILEEGKEAVSGLNIGSKPEMLEFFTCSEDRYNTAMNFSCFGLTRPAITRVGLFDEGFQLAYYEDNDYHHRMKLEEVDGVCDMWAPFTHYGSRTIKEGGVDHTRAFKHNQGYFLNKWGYLP